MRTLVEIDEDIARLEIERDAIARQLGYMPAAQIEIKWARDEVISDLSRKIEDLRAWMKRVFIYVGMGAAVWMGGFMLLAATLPDPPPGARPGLDAIVAPALPTDPG